jgi:hypothetical protein
MFFSQKLKNTFFKESDKGTHFFHSLMNHTHKRNYISTIQLFNVLMVCSLHRYHKLENNLSYTIRSFLEPRNILLSLM